MNNARSHYIYINSKNRNSNEKIYKFNVILNNPIMCNRNQAMNISVIGFSMINTDYNLKGISFSIDEVDIGTTRYNYSIPDGNYSYQSLMEYLNQILVGKIKVEYLKHRNCYKFTNLNPNNYDYYIIPNNAKKYLGVYQDLEISETAGISREGSYINLTNYSHIIIKSNSLDFEDNSQDNINSNELISSNILFTIYKQDVAPFALISYKNYDNGDNYSYNITNRQINSFDLELYNERGELLTETDDYFLILKIVIFNKEVITNSNNFLEDIRFLLMSILFDKKNKNLILK